MPGTIHQNIKSIREIKNYTQQYMSEKLGITQAGYSKIEKGGAGLNFEKLEEIAAVFEMSVQGVIAFEAMPFFQPAVEPSIARKPGFDDLEKLYRDKIGLLEKLLQITEAELKNYKSRCGEI
ncbi:helix-turn-helix transcriptional regulator [Flavobacterium sp. HJSW_4]|uniref:helix-turn-helix transcriptional regulator n=1 Tax=Flavobacterium sp. HJSW_4 TaxID=3344660 RepID=UPI0035F22CCF